MDPIANMLTQIKNAQMVSADRTVLPFSKMKWKIASILKEAGYLSTVDRSKKKAVKAEHDYLELGLKYNDGAGAINGINIVSRPSRHMYAKTDELKPVRSGFGIAVVSTSKGIMTNKEARKEGVGGEVLFEIW
jgi:small subunit ribosomal protein S8